MRTILHVDMDAFYASVEQRDNPSLRGKPLVVGGGSNRGVVAAASYEARRYGIRSAMPMRDALRRCPALVRVPPRIAHYQSVSDEVFAVFNEYTPVIEGLSLDEAFLDISGSLALYGSALAIASGIKERIHARTGLTASVGVAPNKLVAKIASDLEKPDGLVVITTDELPQRLDALPVQVIPGIGRETLARLHRHGIRTMAELRTADASVLEAVFGRFGARARSRASGIDDRPVVSDRETKSISAEETFDEDLKDLDAMHRELLRLTDRCATRLRRKQLFAGNVQLKVRQSDFTTFTRQRALTPPTNGTRALYETAMALLETWLREHPGQAIRLLGVGGSELAAAGQADLFETQSDRGSNVLDSTVDEIRERFGTLSLERARSLDRDRFR